jgi:ABC-type antimicrobial peptide transport system ATPase subunit
MDLLKEITEEYAEEPINLMEAIGKSIQALKLMKKGGKVSNAAIRDFMKKHPSLTTAATINALSAYQQYKTNKRNTVTLFAKTPYDRRMVKKMVDTMVKSKQFKIHRKRWADGGQYYELKKVKIGF